MSRLLLAGCACLLTVAPLYLNEASQAAKDKAHSQNKQTSPKPTAANKPTPSYNGAPQKDEIPRRAVGDDDKPKAIQVTEPLPNDAWYKTYVISTVILVVVGGVGVCMAYRTLRAIDRQGHLMARQTTALEESVSVSKVIAEATNATASAAIKSAETSEKALRLVQRAEVLMDGVANDKPLTPDSRITLVFKNFGPTRANQVVFAMALTIPEVNSPAVPLKPMTMGPSDTQVVTYPAFREWLTEDSFGQITRGEIPLRFHGQVTYLDVFGEAHTTHNAGTFDHQTGRFKVDENQGD